MDAMMQKLHYRLGYRADIEGLRAVAILLVVAAHAGVPMLAGGFVGVDVFFVLSGYLISGLLLQEIHTTRTIDLWQFYAGRLRRLLPGLLSMLLVTGLLGSLLLATGDQLHQAHADAAASLWISNLFFAFSQLDYFGPSASTNLFLHTWSLGVEEQFYLVWPLLIVLALGAWKPRQSMALNRLRWALLAVLMASLLGCLAWTRTAPQLAFYTMPARAWQFALGALVFLFAGAPATGAHGQRMPHATPGHGVFVRRLMGWLGLSLIVGSALWLDSDTAYPGWWALLPSAGAAGVLAAGATSPGSGAGKLLAARPLQALGRVSYGWYLWHWPVLLLGATLIANENLGDRLALAAFALAIAAASYRWLELPIRSHRMPRQKPRIALLVACALMVLAHVAAMHWYVDAATRLTGPQQRKYELARHRAPVIYSLGCDEWYHTDRVKICAFGPPDAPHTAVAFGDSVALQWFPALARVFTAPTWRLLVITKSSCPMVDLPIFYPRIGREYTECAHWRNAALAQIKQLKPDIVVTGSAYTYPYSASQWQAGTERILQSLSHSAGSVYVVRSTPMLPFDGPSCLEPRSRLYLLLSQRSACTAPLTDHRSQAVYQSLLKAANKFGNVTAMDMNDLVCPDGRCDAARGNLIVYRDDRHLTPDFVRTLSGRLATRLGLVTGGQALSIPRD